MILPEKYSEGIEKIFYALKVKRYLDKDYAILKVDLTNKSVNRVYNFYKDTVIDGSNDFIYTYNKIPSDCIQDITEKIRPKIEKFEKEHG